jgi:hypothetical protein
MSLNSTYTKMVHKTGSYTLSVSDDQADFTIAAPANATLPLARTCSTISGQNEKIIINNAGSSAVLTLVAGSGDDLIGATATAATTLAAGQTAYLQGDGVLTWYATGGSGVTGISGASGGSGASGYTGYRGTSGFAGTSGFSGTTGVSGTTGFSGVAGLSGVSGFTGAAGTSGFTGASGQSGFSGASGVTG